MANDRLYIICQCGEWTMLYKFYPVNGYIGGDAERFLNEHVLEHSSGPCSPSMFSLVWENKVHGIANNKERWRPEEAK